MAIALPKDTKIVLGSDATACDSRSLLFDRFSDPSSKEEPRKAWFKRVVALKPCSEKRHSWIRWLGNGGLGLKSEDILFASLQSRLMVNMAGGVMENAGLCLDRFGVPHIPGSAVKGCARRMAIQNLLEARESKEAIGKLARLLGDISLAFGWGNLDWSEKKKDARFLSDLAYALGDQWPEVSKMAGQYLSTTSQFAGSVSFLPAYPYQVPANDLELDIVTCHHPDYYSQKKDHSDKIIMPVALDIEEPNPVLFPATAANIVFQFAVLPIRLERDSLSQPDTKLHVLAREWLRQGLETFGLGAKTAAGYGWFDASEEFNQKMVEKEALEVTLLHKQQAAEAEKLRLKRQEEERIKQIEQKKQALAKLTTEQQEDYKVAQLTPSQFRAKLDSFLTNKVETEKQAVVRALRLEAAAAGSRRAFWDELKAKAQKKGGKVAQVEQSVRQISKQLNLGKMP